MLELIVISTLNGVLFGMLLFLMASGLTVIFSMLGVLNFAHASFYMLGAFFGFQISQWFGFWPALLIAPLLAGAIGAGVERYGLRRVHRNGHVAELLFTFGLAFVIEEIVQIIWGKSPVDFRVPALLDFPAFTIFSTNYPAYKMFMLLVSVAIFVGLLLVLKKTRIGLIVQAALTHPHMVGHLGHNVGRIFMLVFGVGTALAAVAGVIAGPALVTQSNMAGLLGPDPVRGRRGRRAGVAARGVRRLASDRPVADLRGLDERLAVRRVRTAQPGLCLDLARRHLGRDHRADRADHAVSAAGADPDLPPDGPAGDARHMSEITASAAPPPPAAAERLRFYASWLAAAIVLLLLPRIFTSGGSMTTFSLIGISIIFSLSYNILLGQTGMLSFGHAVYYGLGGFLAIHAMNIIGAHKLPIPLPVVPLIGGLSGLFFAVLLGWVSTQRSGTAFAMISLGLAELIASSALILRSFFGGEAGVSANRTKLLKLFDWSFGPQIQIYYLVAAWTLIAVIAMYALTRTPLGRMCNAVRDNPERVQFVGYNPHVVRYLAFCFAGFFAGLAGALAAINFEIANSAYLGAEQSGTVLFATYIGGIGFFIGPIVGAIFVTFLSLGLSDLTQVWQLYFGLIFIAVVMFAPGGLTGLLMMHRPLVKAGTLPKVIAELSDRAGADAGDDRRAGSFDRNHRALHRQSG